MKLLMRTASSLKQKAAPTMSALPLESAEVAAYLGVDCAASQLFNHSPERHSGHLIRCQPEHVGNAFA